MPVHEIVGSGMSIDPVRGQKQSGQEKAKAVPREGKDRVELSDEARALFEADQTRTLDAIRRKINDGFYNKPEVTEKVAEAIVKEFRQEGE